MPVFIGDVLEASGGPVLDLFNNQVIGYQVVGGSSNEVGVPHSNGFSSSNWSELLGGATWTTVEDIPEEFRGQGIFVYDKSLKKYFVSQNQTDFTSSGNFKEIINDFTTYDDAPDLVQALDGSYIPESLGNAIAELDIEKYAFLMRRISYVGDIITGGNSETHYRMTNLDLKNFVVQVLGQGIAQDLIDNGYGTSGSFTNSGSGVLGDLDGDGVVGISDLLILLGNFGNQDVFCDMHIHWGGPNWKSFNPELGAAGQYKATFSQIPPNDWITNPYESSSAVSFWPNNTVHIRPGDTDETGNSNSLDFILNNGSPGTQISDASYIKILEIDGSPVTLDHILKAPGFDISLSVSTAAGTPGSAGGGVYPTGFSVFHSETSQIRAKAYLNFRFIDENGDVIETSTGNNFSQIQLLDYPTNGTPGGADGNSVAGGNNPDLFPIVTGPLWSTITNQYDLESRPGSSNVVVSEMHMSWHFQSGGNVQFIRVENIDLHLLIS